MATFTSNLGVTKPDRGEFTNTWDVVANTSYDIIDRALGGSTSILLAIPGTSGTPNDLGITDGALSDGQYQRLEFTDGGDLGGNAFVRLTPNDAQRIIWVRNSLSANRSIFFSQGTASLEVPAGRDALLSFDGAGTGATVTNVFDNFDSLTLGTLTVEGNFSSGGLVDVAGGTVGARIRPSSTDIGLLAGSVLSNAAAVNLGDTSRVNTEVNILGSGVGIHWLRFRQEDADGFGGLGYGAIGYDMTNQTMLFAVNNNTGAALDTSNCNLGLGTTTPGAALHIEQFGGAILLGFSGGDRLDLIYNSFSEQGEINVVGANPGFQIKANSNNIIEVETDNVHFVQPISINNSSPTTFDNKADDLVIGNFSASSSGISLQSNPTSGVSSFFFSDSDDLLSQQAGGFEYVHGFDQLAFFAGSIARMFIRSSNIIMPSLPTSDPVIAGALWNDSGTVKISAG